MGNKAPTPSLPHEQQVLYTLTLTPGKFPLEHLLDLELLVECEHGQLGPLPLNSVAPQQARRVEAWCTDKGNARFLIIVVHRREQTPLPDWSLQDCILTINRQDGLFESKFRHQQTIACPEASVFSLTLEPYSSSHERSAYRYNEHTPWTPPTDPHKCVKGE